MRQFNRILGFVAVSFVLVFMGKVSKMGLYSAYFKTIADVEIRNSQAFDHGDADFSAALPKASDKALPKGPSQNAALLASLDFAQSTVADVDFSVLQTTEDFQPISHRCFMEVAPRAPGA